MTNQIISAMKRSYLSEIVNEDFEHEVWSYYCYACLFDAKFLLDSFAVLIKNIFFARMSIWPFIAR